MDEIKILFLPAVPRDHKYLKTQEEFSGIKLNIQRSPRMKIATGGDVRQSDLINNLLEENPYFAHFSGHGQRTGIFLLDNDGCSQMVGQNFLITVFQNIKAQSNIRLVFFNACDSTDYAAEIAAIIGCSIGVRGAIKDPEAIQFAKMFYRNIAFGLPIANAFNLSLADTWPDGLPEDGFPQLHTGPGFDAALINPVQQLFKGHALFAYPSLWNSYADVMNFTKHIHHTFQTLDLQYLNHYIDELDGIVRTEEAKGVSNFRAAWPGYTVSYDRFMEEYTHLLALADKAFTLLLNDANDAHLRKRFGDLYKNYYETIKTDIQGYREDHIEASALVRDPSFIRSRERRQLAVIQVSGLLDRARNLTTNSDNLLRDLVYFLTV